MRSKSIVVLLINFIWLCSAEDLFSKGTIFKGASDQPHAKPTKRQFVSTGIRLGKGAFGAVYEATAADGTMWALKFALDSCRALQLLGSAKRGNELYGNPVYYHFNDNDARLSFVATPLVSGSSLQYRIGSSIRKHITFEEFLDVVFGQNGVLSAIVKKLHNRNLLHNDLWIHGNNIITDYDHETDLQTVNLIDFDSLIRSVSKAHKTYELIAFFNMVAYQWQGQSSREDLAISMKGFDWKEYAEVPFDIKQGHRYALNQAKLESFKKNIFENDIFQRLLKSKENIALLGLEKLDVKSKWTFTFDTCARMAEFVQAKAEKPNSSKIRSTASACKSIFLPSNWKQA